MKNLVSLLALSALLSGALLTGCAKEPEPVSDPETATETEKPVEEPKTEEPAEDTTPLPDAPAEGDEVAVLETGKGKIVVMFYPQVAPKTVENFLTLAKKSFYDGTRFHRCMPGFMIQGGDPNSKDMSKSQMWGTGGNTDEKGNEINVLGEVGKRLGHTRGVISMANSGHPDSASSQFFIMHQDAPFLDGGYTAFGKVVKGIEVVDEIVKTGPTDQALNGTVVPEEAIVLKKVTIEKWPVK